MNEQSVRVVEVASFRLKAGISREDFLKTVPATQTYLGTMKGYVWRRLVENADGHWLDLLEWESQADAEAAAAIFSPAKNPAIISFIEALDMSQGSMQHYFIQHSQG